MLDKFKLEDIKNMSYSELQELANEIREKIIDVTSKNGGHLASNLGVVELTIALHKVFNSPIDKIIFDVSHQIYTHKILTGRFDQFDSLRQMDGLSGFAKYSESIHDAYEAGHSSTSISAGLGFLEAKKSFPNQIGEVIAVVGDASIANGLCFEALNYLGAHEDQKMIIIVNDNNMSISKNIGALAKRYNSLRIKHSLNPLRKIVPVRIKHALQYYAYKVDLFTSMGFKYFENIDGHNIEELVKYLTVAKNLPHSIVLHIKTTKGKGYLPAELDEKGIWHGVGPFDKTTGDFKIVKKKQSFGEVICDELIKYKEKDENNLLRVISPATILGSGITEFASRYPTSMIDVGIAEENGVVMASSMALAGLKPIVFVYATFLQRAFDEILHDVARSNLKVIFCVDRAGIIPDDGDTHQGIYDLAMYNAIPGLTVLNPTSDNDARLMINYALDHIDGPIVIRYPKGSTKKGIDTFTNSLSWKTILPGKDYIVSYGPVVDDIYHRINEEQINIGLLAASVISPIDEKFIDNLEQNSTLYVYEDVIYNGSLASNLLSYINKNKLNIKIVSISLKNTYVHEGKVDELKKRHLISLDDLMTIVKEGITKC